MKVVRTTCRSCHGGCGVRVTVRDGRAVYIEGDRESITCGKMCAKGIAALLETENPARLKFPLRRIGDRGGGRWERISWEEALDTIAATMKESAEIHGPNSVLIGQGTFRGYNRYTARLARTIGTANYLTPGYFCIRPRILVSQIMFGVERRLYCDYYGWGGVFPKTHIMWGRQLEISNADGELAANFLDALNKAKNLIIIDPRATPLTRRATLWLQIRPGTDAALALGMMNIIMKEKLYDNDFIDNWTYGFKELKRRVEEYPIEKVSKITWIPEEKIINAARMFARDTPGVIQVGQAVEGTTNSIQNVRAIYCLLAITGNIEKPGAMVSWLAPDGLNFGEFVSEIPFGEEQKLTAVGAEKHRLLAKAGLCHPDSVFRELKSKQSVIKTAHWQGGNPLLCYTNSPDVLKGILNLDLISVADLYMSKLAAIADIILPVAHWLEINDIWGEIATFRIGAINKAVEPPGEAWSDLRIINEIGRRIAPNYWFKDEKECLNYQLKNTGLSWDEFAEMCHLVRGDGKQPYWKYKSDYWRNGGGFLTPTGRVELYSTVLAELGYDPLPAFNEPPESPYSAPELVQDYPLILSTGGRIPVYFHSEFRNNPWLRELHPNPTVQIHPSTASKLGIEDGDWVWVETPRGRILLKAELFGGIHPRVVIAEASWENVNDNTRGKELGNTNINILTSNAPPYDPAIGATSTRALLCKVYKQ